MSIPSIQLFSLNFEETPSGTSSPVGLGERAMMAFAKLQTESQGHKDSLLQKASEITSDPRSILQYNAERGDLETQTLMINTVVRKGVSGIEMLVKS